VRVIDYFDKGARHNGDRFFLVSNEGDVTYAEAAHHSWQLAAGFYAQGFSPGEGVGVLASNVSDALLGMLGLWRAGGTWAPLNHLNALDATIDFMNEVQLQWLLLHSRFADDVDEIRARVPTLKHIVCLDKPFDGADPMSDFLAAGAGVEVPDWSDPAGAPDAVCGTWPTGGTTGKSKAVVWTNDVVANLIELCTGVRAPGEPHGRADHPRGGRHGGHPVLASRDRGHATRLRRRGRAGLRGAARSHAPVPATDRVLPHTRESNRAFPRLLESEDTADRCRAGLAGEVR
jgi:acyl-CoA synthetase (AMP-forming)/AMP-acid ligase II